MKIDTMPRQKKCRMIEYPPIYDGYRPIGIGKDLVDIVSLQLEEYEAIRLADYENLRQEESAKCMQVSRPTFTRIYNSARKKIAQAFVEGKMLLFEGGDINVGDEWYKCNNCNDLLKIHKGEQLICSSCMSTDISSLKDNIEKWKEEQQINKIAKQEVVCISCGYSLKTNKKDYACPQCGNRMEIKNKQNKTNMKRIALPIEGENLCTHFGAAKEFIFLNIENGEIKKEETLPAPKHEPGVLPKWLIQENVTDVIAAGMGEKAIQILENGNVTAHTGVKADTIKNIVSKFIDGSLIVTFAKCTHDHDHDHKH